MKTSLFLVLAGATFALCNCQQQPEQPSTPVEPPVAPAPIKVVADKNEITPVTIGGGLAPASVKGKTLTIRSAKTGVKTYNFFLGNNTAKTMVNGSLYRAEYEKTAAKTAHVRLTPWQPCDAGWMYINLTFTTANTGSYQHEVEKCTDGSEPNEVVDTGTFTIK